MVNNAAPPYGEDRVPVVEVDNEVFKKVIFVKVYGSLMSKHVASVMQKQKSGTIILTSSGAGVLGSSSSFAYGSSKGGVHGLSLVLEDKLSIYSI